jgi:hypothetical protein
VTGREAWGKPGPNQELLRPAGRDFPTRGKDPSNLTRVIPP